MKLITDSLTEQLLANGRAQRAAIDKGDNALDFKPVVKLFTPDAQCTWLLTELDPDGGLAFGLCDLGLGCPELGYVSLTELYAVRGKLGLPVERDRHFERLASRRPTLFTQCRILVQLPRAAIRTAPSSPPASGHTPLLDVRVLPSAR